MGDMEWWPRRVYLSARADDGADIVWTAEDGLTVWTRLNSDDSRAWGDRVLDEAPNRTVANGIISLPCGMVAVCRLGAGQENSFGQFAHYKWITEYDDNGKVIRDVAVQSWEYQNEFQGWEPRVGEFNFGFWRDLTGVKEMAYYVFGATVGGGHQGSRGILKRHPNMKGHWGFQGCSHNLASRGVHNHQAQMTGNFCLRDGVGGIYQFLPKYAENYRFRYDYGYPLVPLGDVVAWGGGFFVSFAAPRKNNRDNWSSDAAARTDVGVIFVPADNQVHSNYDQITWLTSTADKTESLVHLVTYGTDKQRLLIFWVETDTFSVQWDWQNNRLDPAKTGARYMVAMLDTNLNIVQGPEEIGDTVTWGELQTFTSFRNGDVGWVGAWRMREGTNHAPDHFYGPPQESLKMVRLRFTDAVEPQPTFAPVEKYTDYPVGMNPLWDDPDPTWCLNTEQGSDANAPEGVSPGTIVTSVAFEPTVCLIGCDDSTITTSTTSTTQEGAPTSTPQWSSVKDGVDQACRGANSNDNSASYFLLSQQGSAADCKAQCVLESRCKGIEYSNFGRCELWIRPGGIKATKHVPGFTCLRYAPSAFQPIGGGHNQACRGATSLDNSPSYYVLNRMIYSLYDCEALCESAQECKGIEYSHGRCEVWTRPAGIQATTTLTGFSCYKYEPIAALGKARKAVRR